MHPARDGERPRDAMRPGVRRRAAGHAGDLHATLLGHPQLHRPPSQPPLHLRHPDPPADRPDRADLPGCRGVRPVDDPPALRLRHELPHRKVPAGPEQDDGYGGDLSCHLGPPHPLQLAPHAEARVGPRRRRRGPQFILGAHRRGSAGVHLRRRVRPCVVRLLVEGVPEPVGLRPLVSRLRRDALASI